MILQFIIAAGSGLAVLISGLLWEMSDRRRWRLVALLVLSVGMAGLLGCALLTN